MDIDNNKLSTLRSQHYVVDPSPGHHMMANIERFQKLILYDNSGPGARRRQRIVEDRDIVVLKIFLESQTLVMSLLKTQAISGLKNATDSVQLLFSLGIILAQERVGVLCSYAKIYAR